MISCLVLDTVRIYCIITFYCLSPSFLQIHNSDLCYFPHFTFISGEEPYHGCTDIKPLLLLLLLLLFAGSLVYVSFCLILFKVAQTLTLHAYVRLPKI